MCQVPFDLSFPFTLGGVTAATLHFDGGDELLLIINSKVATAICIHFGGAKSIIIPQLSSLLLLPGMQ